MFNFGNDYIWRQNLIFFEYHIFKIQEDNFVCFFKNYN